MGIHILVYRRSFWVEQVGTIILGQTYRSSLANNFYGSIELNPMNGPRIIVKVKCRLKYLASRNLRETAYGT